MVEFEKEPDFTRMAMDMLKLSPKERRIIFDYNAALLLYVILVMDNPENYPEEIDVKGAREFANQKFPNDLKLINEVWKKTIEIESTFSSKSNNSHKISSDKMVVIFYGIHG